MSSTRKDARWELAHQISVILHEDWYSLPYARQSGLLAAAEDILADFPVSIPLLASDWNSHGN